jgi:hypothetical protein
VLTLAGNCAAQARTASGLRQPHPLIFLVALDVDPAQLRRESR